MTETSKADGEKNNCQVCLAEVHVPSESEKMARALHSFNLTRWSKATSLPVPSCRAISILGDSESCDGMR